MRYARIVVLLQHASIPCYFSDWATFASYLFDRCHVTVCVS